MNEEKKQRVQRVKNTITDGRKIVTTLVRNGDEVSVTDLSHFPQGAYVTKLALVTASSALLQAAQGAKEEGEDAMIRAILLRAKELENGTYEGGRATLTDFEKAVNRFKRKHDRLPTDEERKGIRVAVDLGIL